MAESCDSRSEGRGNEGLRLLGRPCPGCPWRCDKSAADIPGFSLEKARGLAATSPDARGFGPSFGAPLFACHQSKEGEELACAGWLATVGACHPNVRLAVISGRLDGVALRPAPDWPALHDDCGDVLRKLEQTES